VPKKLSLAGIILLLAASSISLAQTLQTLVNQPPAGAGLGFLLTDGSVMFQGNGLSNWSKLTPDKFGSYVKGTWSQLASLPSGYVPDAFASAVLGDGRLVIVGGEYNNGNFALTNKGAIYDPKKDTWTALGHPTGWGYIGDSPSAVLPDGRFVVGRKLDHRVAALDPATLQWTELGDAGKSDFNAEEGWTLMPDGSVLTFDVKHAPHSERYIPSQQKWVSRQHNRGLALATPGRLYSLWRRMLPSAGRGRPRCTPPGRHCLRDWVSFKRRERPGTHRYLSSYNPEMDRRPRLPERRQCWRLIRRAAAQWECAGVGFRGAL
jgi:hypothetical protein